MSELELSIEPSALVPDGGGWSAQLASDGDGTSRLEVRQAVSGAAAVLDGPAFAALPAVMRRGGTLHVAGALTRGALRNLIEISEAWHDWRPGAFHRIEVSAATIVDARAAAPRRAAVFAWSGSLRSVYSLLRNVDGSIPGAFQVAGAVWVSGCHAVDGDLPPARIEVLRGLLADRGVRLGCVQLRQAGGAWLDEAVGPMSLIAAALHALAPRRTVAVHGRDRQLRSQLRFPRPGPELPDLWSGDASTIRADGGGITPPAMALAVARHPELVPWVSGCRRRSRLAPACGRCDDCVLTALAFVAAAVVPPGPAMPITATRIARLALRTPEHAAFAEEVLGDWRDGPRHLRRALSARVARGNLVNAIADQARWIGSATGLRPIWPR